MVSPRSPLAQRELVRARGAVGASAQRPCDFGGACRGARLCARCPAHAVHASPIFPPRKMCTFVEQMFLVLRRFPVYDVLSIARIAFLICLHIELETVGWRGILMKGSVGRIKGEFASREQRSHTAKFRRKGTPGDTRARTASPHCEFAGRGIRLPGTGRKSPQKTREIPVGKRKSLHPIDTVVILAYLIGSGQSDGFAGP